MKTQDVILSFYRMLSRGDINLERSLQNTLVKDQSIDWTELLQALKYHKLHVLFYRHFKEFIPAAFLCYFSHEYHQSIAWQKVLLDELKILNKSFKDNKVPFLLLKGFSIGHEVYGSIYMRPTNDLDILLLDQDTFNQAQSIAESLNYSVFYKKKDYSFGVLPKGYRMKHTGYHETQYSKIIDDKHFIDAELHLNTGSLDESIIDFFKMDPQHICIEGMDLLIMNKTHFFLYLCANTHENFELNFSVYNNTYVRDVLDVIMYAKNNLNQKDWIEIEKLSKKYRIYHRVCAVMFYASQLDPSDPWVKQMSEKFYFDSDGSKFYDHGAYVDWKMNFIDRVFQPEKRCIEYSKLYVQHCFSSKNPNYTPYKAYLKDSLYMEYHNKALNLPLRWKFETIEGSLYACFIDLVESLPLEKYSLEIKFLVNPAKAYENGGNPMCSFSLQLDNMLHKYVLKDGDGTTVCVEKKKDNVSKFRIPLEKVHLHKGKFIAYNMIFCKKVYRDCLEWSGGLFEDYNPKGELGIIQLHE